MNKNTVTKVAFLVDRSGSMASLRDSTIEGVNGYLASQNSLTDRCEVSFYQFNDTFQKVFGDRPVTECPKLTKESYIPQGGTALLDATASMIEDFQKSCTLMDQVIVILITDGEENGSRNKTKAQVADLIKAKTAEGWNFTFLGANIDAFAEAQALGISRDSTLSFNANVNSNAAIYKALEVTTNMMREGKSVGEARSISYNAEDRAAVNLEHPYSD